MLMKRHSSPATIENPFVKPENLSWEIAPPASLRRSFSPPPTPRRRKTGTPSSKPTKSTSAQVEAGEIEIEDHVTFFSSKLLAAQQPDIPGQPRISHGAWLDLYKRNLSDRGHHFVVHQHDHPQAGTHYDLRLQCNATSSISFSIPYGLPGNANSKRLLRNAIETRVHNLWNHLIETASHDTGTMLLWDTGEYTVLPYHSTNSTNGDATTDEDSDSDTSAGDITESEPQKLHRAFLQRKIKLRLNGTRLPKNYTIYLRLSGDNDRFGQPDAPAFKRRRRTEPQPQIQPTVVQKQQQQQVSFSTSESSQPSSQDTLEKTLRRERELRDQHQRIPSLKRSVSSLHRTTSPPASKRDSVTPSQAPFTTSTATQAQTTTSTAQQLPQLAEKGQTEDDRIRFSNAYTGATNDIGSIHQRKWFLSIDRKLSGFIQASSTSVEATTTSTPISHRPTSSSRTVHPINPRGSTGSKHTWIRPFARKDGAPNGFEPFNVLGRDVETSILTGRKAADVARDEGLVGYRPRGGWHGVRD